MNDYAELCSDGKCHECYRCLSRQDHAALAASQADVARFAAELAGSVRALAVSQDEAKGWMKVYGKQIQTSAGLALELSAARGDLERARALAKRLVGSVELHDNCRCILCDFVRFLAETAPPTPTASPEPDRDPEVNVKEPR